MTPAISFFRSYLIRTSRNAVKTRRIAMKMNGFATDVGSWKADDPRACTGSERSECPISTAMRRSGHREEWDEVL